MVDCPPEVQIERVVARSGLPRAQIEQILAAQATRAQRLAAADLVVFNGEGVTLRELRTAVQELAARFGL